MRFDILTIFPEFFRGPLDYGILRRARQAGRVQVEVHDLRRWARDRHRTVDDRPFGGGEGMVLKPEPIFEAVEELLGVVPQQAVGSSRTAVILLSAAGRLFRQPEAQRLAAFERVVLICGRYEGVDERVAEHLATDEISVGDFVLSGGELPAALLVDAVVRLLPGVLGNEASRWFESFSAPSGAAAATLTEQTAFSAAPGGILDCPHYTRPQEFRGWTVPEVLVSGHHEQIRRWRRKMALAKTLRNRPELLAAATLSEEDHALLEELRAEAAKAHAQPS
ncbi:MAG: tRNA (guanosine(37)-N1)-methyltransferase TrmD [Firmicutes bacterium]|nr:tRNA (guanosine(37)-N1)-methyltransferase TrmD [Bacillota bacterium]